MSKIFYVYIVLTSGKTLYTGQTNNLERRLLQHAGKKTDSAKYLKLFESFTLVYSEQHSTRSEAMRREMEIKKWPRAKKVALIKSPHKNTIGLIKRYNSAIIAAT